jgi:hypothetical protein
VLVAETNGPARPDDRKGIKGWLMGLFMVEALPMGDLAPTWTKAVFVATRSHGLPQQVIADHSND